MKEVGWVRVVGERVVLVPYREVHVEKYHGWMGDADLLRLTASLPLSLQEERDMQHKWAVDPDKWTFIVLSKELYEEKGGNEIESMVGDVNLFLVEKGEGEAELEVMIAESSVRGKGLGKEAAALMMKFGQLHLNLQRTRVKIKRDNTISIGLFRKFGFVKTEESEVFDELTMQLSLNNPNTLLHSLWNSYSEVPYVP